MSNRIIIIVLILFLLSGYILQASDKDKAKLREFEEAVEKPNDNDSDEDESDEDGNSFLEFIFGRILYHTFIGVPSERIYYNDFFWHHRFNSYPWEEDRPGMFAEAGKNSIKLQMQCHYFSDLDDIKGVNFKTDFYCVPFFKLTAKSLFLQEKVEDKIERLDFHNFQLNYVRVRSQYFEWWWGVGAKLMEGNNSNWGVNFSTGMNIYPIKPVELSLDYYLGSIREQTVSEIEIDLSLFINRIKIYTGFQGLYTNETSLKGMNLGIGIQF